MTKTGFALVLLGIFLAASFQNALAQTSAKAAGHWEGVIHMSNPHTGESRDLAITLDLDRNSGGTWVGSISVLKSTSIDVPLHALKIEDSAIRFEADLPQSSSFTGRLSADANELAGTASNIAGQAPFQLQRKGVADVKIPPPSTPLSNDFQGTWQGSIDVDGKSKRVILKLFVTADGLAAASLISMDEGNLSIPVTTVRVKDKQIELDARSVSGKYQGTLGRDQEISGEWTQGAAHLPLRFTRASSDSNH